MTQPLITVKQLEVAFAKHIHALQEIERGFSTGEDLEPLTRKTIEATQRFLSRIVYFRDQEENNTTDIYKDHPNWKEMYTLEQIKLLTQD